MIGPFLAVGTAACGAALVVYGAARWRRTGRQLRIQMRSEAAGHARPGAYRESDLADLPPPVRSYLRRVLRDGQPLIQAAEIRQRGRLRLSETRRRWLPYTSTQLVTPRPPGFLWEARLAVAPGLAVFVRDGYIAGEGLLQASVLGLATVASCRGRGEIADSELMRYLAEAPWYPTALLPGHPVRWQQTAPAAAQATIANGDTQVSIEFCFGDDGLVRAVRTQARYRAVAGSFVPTPWEGSFFEYAERSGMLVPTRGQVRWIIDGQPFLCWEGELTGITYDWAT